MAFPQSTDFSTFSDTMFKPDPGLVASMVDMMALPAEIAVQNTEILCRMSLFSLKFVQDVFTLDGVSETAVADVKLPEVESVEALDVQDPTEIETKTEDAQEDAVELAVAAPADEPAPAIDSVELADDVVSEMSETTVSEPTETEIVVIKPDNLRLIRGVGPKLATHLMDMGITQFSQIAEWSPEKASEMQAQLISLRGRPVTDNWISQATALAKSKAKR